VISYGKQSIDQADIDSVVEILKGDFPISENFYQNEVSLPVYPDLSNKDVSLVIDSILEIIPT